MKLITQNIDFGKFYGFGPLGTGQGSNSIETFSKVISTTIGVMTIVGFIWFTFTLFTGAIAIIGSGGDKQALESARKKITNGVVGVVIVISAIFILDLIGIIFKVNFLTLGQLFYFVTSP